MPSDPISNVFCVGRRSTDGLGGSRALAAVKWSGWLDRASARQRSAHGGGNKDIKHFRRISPSANRSRLIVEFAAPRGHWNGAAVTFCREFQSDTELKTIRDRHKLTFNPTVTPGNGSAQISAKNTIDIENFPVVALEMSPNELLKQEPEQEQEQNNDTAGDDAMLQYGIDGSTLNSKCLPRIQNPQEQNTKRWSNESSDPKIWNHAIGVSTPMVAKAKDIEQETRYALRAANAFNDVIQAHGNNKIKFVVGGASLYTSTNSLLTPPRCPTSCA
ncbi:hypothetical protein B0H16DRAFT_1693213 [Mycena metata]|uniref:Uncharacterized protein n=1 Tax=Mycena metata TaxID=1033252 RepID=A0AAD7ILQ4_9AGAR|nr:hypothetical protein B0H16DRAFT_1693213 [Mycena metata]